jgi:ketosteroid isomerase-like protein
VPSHEKKMTDNLDRQRVLNFLAAYYGGDTDAAQKCCAEDVLLMVYLPVELFPHLGPQHGRKAISDLMAVLDARYSKRQHEVKFIVADRQQAAAIVDVTYTKRSDGRVIQLPSGNFFSLRGGLITEIRSFFDTIDWVSQLTGRDMVGPLLREAGPALRPPNLAPPPLKRVN